MPLTPKAVLHPVPRFPVVIPDKPFLLCCCAFLLRLHLSWALSLPGHTVVIGPSQSGMLFSGRATCGVHSTFNWARLDPCCWERLRMLQSFSTIANYR